MGFVKLGALAALPPGALSQVIVGDKEVVLCNSEGTVHAFNGQCPHQQGPLGEGNFDSNTIICPWHGWEFNCITGENDFDPELKLERYPVEVRDNEIYVNIPEA